LIAAPLTESNDWPVFSGETRIGRDRRPAGRWASSGDNDVLTPGKPNHIGILSRGPLLKRVPGGNI